ncbi:MAG: hypothetical protein J6U53_02075 [Tidjanibacter sp.]|nr:hypothetical protein [Tidjanibacter sp.]
MKKLFLLAIALFVGVIANAQVNYGGASQIEYGMKYKDLKNIYDYRDYDSRGFTRYSPTWSGIGSFVIPGLGQICCGEVWHGLGHVALNVGIGMWANASATNGDMDNYYLLSLVKVCFNIWSIVDAVRVAKVKNMYENDLRVSRRSDISFDVYPSLNSFQYNGNVNVASGMTFAINF